MRIGVSVITHEGQHIWSNGLAQHVFFFARMLRAMPFVEEVILLNCGSQTSFVADGEGAFPLIPPREATDRVDVVVEMSGALDVEWLDYVRALGKKVAWYICGTPYVPILQPSLFAIDDYFGRIERSDALWVVEQHALWAPMLAALNRTPAFTVPLIWGPDFIEARARDMAAQGTPFGVRGGADAWPEGGVRTAIFEPNITITKSSVIPMLICDEAARRDPTAIDRMTVLNSLQMSEHLTFSYLVNSLDLTKAGKTKLEARHDFAGVMAHFGDAVVTHQWDNKSNYVYCDALYGDYPLIHNSTWVGDAGYFYPGWDVEAGAQALLRAHREHLRNLDDYHARARRFLASIDPLHPRNIEIYARRLLALVADGEGGAR
jgi:hypothetical protein